MLFNRPYEPLSRAESAVRALPYTSAWFGTGDKDEWVSWHDWCEIGTSWAFGSTPAFDNHIGSLSQSREFALRSSRAAPEESTNICKYHS